MKIIKPRVEILHSGLETEFMTPAQFIEMVGRTCYKSEDKITDGSAEKFVSGLIKREHEAMIEHWTLIFKTATPSIYDLIQLDLHRFTQGTDINTEELNPRLRFTCKGYISGAKSRPIVSGNIRAWRDFVRLTIDGYGMVPPYLRGLIRNNPLFFPEWYADIPAKVVAESLCPISVNDLVGWKEHSVHHDVTVKFICDRGVSHEIVRHREASFAQESTRYCNYSGEKYGKEITVICPTDIRPATLGNAAYVSWLDGCTASEAEYFSMLSEGCTPQTARSVLNNSLKTEVIMTANLAEWDHFFKLRCAPDAHPDMQVSAKLARDEFVKLFPERYA